MQSLRPSSRHLLARVITSILQSKGSWGRVVTLLSVVVLLTSEIQLYAQRRTATTSLALQVRPEELLQVQNGSVVLKIRLGPGTIASIWAAASCTLPASQSQVISVSGTYTFPLHTLMSVLSDPNPSATQVCLVSSDGALNDSAPARIAAIGNGTAGQDRTPQLAPDGVSVAGPDGWSLTTQAGTTTWSKP